MSSFTENVSKILSYGKLVPETHLIPILGAILILGGAFIVSPINFLFTAYAQNETNYDSGENSHGLDDNGVTVDTDPPSTDESTSDNGVAGESQTNLNAISGNSQPEGVQIQILLPMLAPV